MGILIFCSLYYRLLERRMRRFLGRGYMVIQPIGERLLGRKCLILLHFLPALDSVSRNGENVIELNTWIKIGHSRIPSGIGENNSISKWLILKGISNNLRKTLWNSTNVVLWNHKAKGQAKRKLKKRKLFAPPEVGSGRMARNSGLARKGKSSIFAGSDTSSLKI